MHTNWEDGRGVTIFLSPSWSKSVRTKPVFIPRIERCEKRLPAKSSLKLGWTLYLSPQVLLGLTGGQLVKTSADVRLCLGNELVLISNYCPCSRLPLFHLLNSFGRKNFWVDAFAYTSNEVRGVGQGNLLQSSNSNLSASQKDLLLLHYCLSHNSLSWIQLLMRDRKWLRCNAPKISLHKGSFIPCKVTRGPVCNLTCLTLSACLLENVRICTPCASSKNSIAWSPSTSLLIILRIMH